MICPAADILALGPVMDSDDLTVRSRSRRLPPVRIVGIDTVPMTSEQYEGAVAALAALISEWARLQ